MPGTLANTVMRSILSSRLYPLLGAGFAIVMVEGRSSGREYSTPVNVVRDGDTFTILSLASRTWWRNLRGGRAGTLLVSGTRLPVRGEVIEAPDQVSEALHQHFVRHPELARFFKVRLGPDGLPVAQGVAQASAGRVVVRLHTQKVS